MNEQKKYEGKEGIKHIKDKVIKRHHPNAVSLSMERVPKDIVDVFKRFANDEFVGDYGLAFKSLVDHMLIEPSRFDQVYSLLEDHERRLSELEGKGVQKTRKIKRLSGKVTEIPIKE